MKKGKLVRDNIHELYKYREMHTADDEEYWEALIDKLNNEIDKFNETGSVEELVDILEVVHAISEFRGVSVKELESMREDKANKRGRFKKRIIFEPVMEEEQ